VRTESEVSSGDTSQLMSITEGRERAAEKMSLKMTVSKIAATVRVCCSCGKSLRSLSLSQTDDAADDDDVDGNDDDDDSDDVVDESL